MKYYPGHNGMRTTVSEECFGIFRNSIKSIS